MKTNQDFTHVRGDDLQVPVTVELDGGRTLDGTESWKWELKRSVGSPVLVAKTSPSGVTIDGSTNQPTIVLTPSDFPVLEFPASTTDQVFAHELQMTKSSKVETVLRGTLTLISDLVQ